MDVFLQAMHFLGIPTTRCKSLSYIFSLKRSVSSAVMGLNLDLLSYEMLTFIRVYLNEHATFVLLKSKVNKSLDF